MWRAAAAAPPSILPKTGWTIARPARPPVTPLLIAPIYLLWFSLFLEKLTTHVRHTCIPMLSLDKGHAVYCFSHKLSARNYSRKL
jgi:hypothetical protein